MPIKRKKKTELLEEFNFFFSMAFELLSSSTSPAIKWLGFVTAIWVQAVAGNNYTFSNYSDALKSLMELSQLQLNNLSVAKDVGKAFGILAGLASDRLPTSVILIIGAVEGLIGYGVQWLVVSHKIHPLPYWQVRTSFHSSAISFLVFIIHAFITGSFMADVCFSLHGREQYDMDEHSCTGNLHKKLQEQPRTSFRNLERLCWT